MAVGIEIATQTPKKIATIRAISPPFSGWPERRYPVEGRRNMVRGIRVTRPQVRHRSGDRAPHGASRRLGSTLEGPAAGSRWRSRRKPLEDAASARATNDQGKLVFRPRKGLPRMADISVANTTYRGAHDGAQPVRDSLGTTWTRVRRARACGPTTRSSSTRTTDHACSPDASVHSSPRRPSLTS